MFKCSKVTNLHEFTKKSFFYSCLEKFTVYRPLWKQQKININAVQTQCHIRNVNTKKVYLIILIIDVWSSRLATKQLSNINLELFNTSEKIWSLTFLLSIYQKKVWTQYFSGHYKLDPLYFWHLSCFSISKTL